MLNLISKIYAAGTGGGGGGGGYQYGSSGDPVISVLQPDQVRISQIGPLISSLVTVLLIVAALAAFLYLVLGGLQWITSGGDKAGMEAARNKITQAIVGLVIVAAAYAVMLLITQFLGISLDSLTLPQPF